MHSKLRFSLSLYPLMFSRSKLKDEAKMSLPRHVLSSWRGHLHLFRPSGQNMPQHTQFSFISELTNKLHQGENKSHSEYLVRNRVHRRYFFNNISCTDYSQSLLNKKFYQQFYNQITQRILLETFLLFWGLLNFSLGPKTFFLDLHQVKVICYCQY